MKQIALLALLAIATVGCTNPERSRETLIDSGFTQVEITGYDWFGCGKDDTYSTGFTARNSRGQRVSGTVCCGLLKGCTVRF